MAFLRSLLPEDYLEPIRGPKLTLRPPSTGDYAAWAQLRAMSRAHLVPWEPAWTREELTRASFRRRLRAYGHDARDDHGYSFFICSPSGTLLGGLTLSNIRRGAAQTAALGYWTGAPFTRQGHMSEAVRMIVPFAFRSLRLHRLEAATMADNIPSQRVLEKSGFTCEGLARGFLKINGAWEDHQIYAMTEEDALSKGLVQGTQP